MQQDFGDLTDARADYQWNVQMKLVVYLWWI